MRRILAVGLLVAAACSGTGATTTITTDSTESTPTTPPAVTVTADNGAVTVPGPPQRIVSLSATHTEILFALGAGDRVVGTDLTSNYPPAAENTAKVDAFNFSVEAVAALEPDLVILAFDFQGETDALDTVGIPTLLLGPARDLEAVYDQIRILEEATYRFGAGTDLITDMRNRIDTALAAVDIGAVAEPTVYHEVDDTLFSANSDTLLGDIYARLGLMNLADEVPDEFGSGFVQLSREFILARNPWLIVLGDASFGVTAESLRDRPGWDQLGAVAGGRVVELLGDVPGRWGPRTADLVEQLATDISALE